jgi:hypothetical protein
VIGACHMRILSVSLCIVAVTTACESLAVYDGEKRPDAELAQIVGDSHLSRLPLSIYLRQVDGEDIGVRYRGVKVLPGEHDLLIDCTVTESQQTSRHHLHVEVDAGVKYRIAANTVPGNRECSNLELVARY